MDWLKPYLVCRVRVACLRAIVDAGGDVAGWQLRRALEPVLGDLLPLPDHPLPGKEARARALRRSPATSSGDRHVAALGSMPADRTSFAAVDKNAE